MARRRGDNATSVWCANQAPRQKTDEEPVDEEGSYIEVFQLIDAAGVGHISKKQLFDFLLSLEVSDEEAGAIANSAKSSEILQEEFVSLMRGKLS